MALELKKGPVRRLGDLIVFCFFVAPRLVVGAIYKHLNETMKLPWTADIQTNTVHVTDLVRAIVHVTANGQRGQVRKNFTINR